VINLLLDLIKTRLQDDLVKIVPKAQWHGVPLEQVKTPKLPGVAIYGGVITFLPIRQDRSLEQNCREFQQEFWIDLLGRNSAQVEQITSLTVGLISLHQQSWLTECNQPLKDDAHYYQSATIATRHRFRQIQMIGASSDYEQEKVRSRLEFLAFGQLEITKLEPDSPALLQTISTTGTLGQLQGNQLESDQATQWKTQVKSDQIAKRKIDINKG
jgi:hypothetical protein